MQLPGSEMCLRVKETRTGENLGLDTRMLSVIIVTEHDISRGIVFYGRRIVKTRRVSKKRRIMMMTV